MFEMIILLLIGQLILTQSFGCNSLQGLRVPPDENSCNVLFDPGKYPDHTYLKKMYCGYLDENQSVKIHTSGEYPDSVWEIFPRLKGYHQIGLTTAIMKEHKGNFTLPCYHEGPGEYGFEVLTTGSTELSRHFFISFERYKCN